MVSGEFSENAFRKDFIISEMAEIKRALEPEIKREAEIRMKAGRLRQVRRRISAVPNNES